ncbi:hypothetical protein [Aneurinibacillus aneurinilyticus]|uniref:hypothetical protein n=1 Tax=Aneurinibacillus aneurinilyticus TaxID=1391 RepID=UPI0011DD39B7|nr:hypothetical protein [Aneurinibacillus aneurinilyticus]MCI1693111.1 hypothetical protein [Aneurinibacillus aneurinilyticus]MED0705483.1 hypothetical protein [Aneurinibacillus aneurinilyticus]MED0721909.1 hypothetical protein [Aneurinibacillus aneurinilyticus]MED0731501.1 hypothetical protein [Aneurinibacillus aneurinilyticus]MED0743033.1 hypothetical protein [Aneurinibacillus aneurinilyticus]
MLQSWLKVHRLQRMRPGSKLSFAVFRPSSFVQKKTKVSMLPVTDRYLILSHKKREDTYVMDKEGGVFNPRTSEQLLIPKKWKSKLKAYGDMTAASHYGELLPWNEVKKDILNKSVLTVIDLETGLQFQAQRRAGKYHADVQPLTKSDTKIMKQIYNGKWSWKRKAILVEKDGRYYAASMQGMPHGGDGIPGNGFSGHFCIHFLDSLTHGSRNKDPEHHLMIYKAAGKLDTYFKSVTPHELVDSFIGAVNAREPHILSQCFLDLRHVRLLEMQKELPNIQVFRRVSKYTKKKDMTNVLTAEIPVEIRMERKGKRTETVKMVFHVGRNTKQSPWKIINIK